MSAKRIYTGGWIGLPLTAVRIEAESPARAKLAVFKMLKNANYHDARYTEVRVHLDPLCGAGEPQAPIFGNGAAVLKAWLEGQGKDPDLVVHLTEHAPAIAACLRTAMVCKPNQRRAIVAAIRGGGGDLTAAFAAYNEERRTSTNNICRKALAVANHVDASHAERQREAGRG